MFNLAIESKLRACDVVALKVEDVAPNGYAADRATVRQRKTGQPVRFELTEQTRQAVDVVVVGGGPAGLTAALQAGRLGARTTLVNRGAVGGMAAEDGPVPVRVLAQAARLHREAPINPGQFDNYVGRYQVDANFTITVSRDRGHLYIQGTGQPRAELFFEGDDKFFLRVVDAEVTFQTAENGRTHGLELRQGDKRVLATAVN